jgi:ketosteroid isomerase-like protein
MEIMKLWSGCRAAALAALLVASGAGCDARPAGGDGRSEATAGGAAGGAESAVAQLFQAMNARDTDRVLAHYDRSGDLVQVACTDVRRGFARVESIVRMWHEDNPGIRIEHEVVRSVLMGDDAAVVAAQGRNQQGLALFWTFVLRQDSGDRWLIVQEHQSWADCREPRIHRMGPE